MPQGVLPFQYVGEGGGKGMTALAGLGLYLDLLHAAGVPAAADREIGVRDGQGYRDGQLLTALVLLNLAGGEGVRDVEVLEQDEGLCALVRRAEGYWARTAGAAGGGAALAERAQPRLPLRVGHLPVSGGLP